MKQSHDHQQMNYYRGRYQALLAKQATTTYLREYYQREAIRARILMGFHALFVADSVNLPRRPIVVA
jgi:hypothetical protein